MNQPQTYQEWRALWHRLARRLGWLVFLNLRMGRAPIGRQEWKLYDQLRRVKLRMDVEAGAWTTSYAKAFYDALSDSS